MWTFWLGGGGFAVGMLIATEAESREFEVTIGSEGGLEKWIKELKEDGKKCKEDKDQWKHLVC